MMNEWILSSCVLIAGVLLLRWLLRGRISLRLQYALWAVVLVRLLLPVQLFTSDFGTGSIAKEVDIAAPVQQVYFSANEDRYEREYDEAYRQVVAQYEALHQQFNQSYDPIVVEKTAQDMAQQRLELDLNALLHRIWFAGMVVMTAVIAACNAHLSLQLKRRRWELEVPGSLLPVYITEVVPTPCVFGLFRPAVYLTPEAAKDPQVRAHVLEHELTHYRHFDHVWSVLRSVCLVLHWYNPLVWLAAKVSRADAELACDEGALARLGEDQRGDYGRTLIGLTCSAPISELLLTATTMTGSAGSIRERIRLLMKRPRNTALTVTALVLMITLIVGCTFAGAPQTTPGGTTHHDGTVPSISVDPPTPSGVDNDMAYTGQELPIPNDPSAPIAAAFAGEDFRAYHAYHSEETEYLSSIGFTSAGELLGLEFGLLNWTDTAGWQMEVLYSFPFMKPDYPFLAQVPFWGDTTTYGIRFTDERGIDRHFAISISGEDGGLICVEYFPGLLGLRNTDGLLVFPGTQWGMTEAELIAALNIQEYGIFSGLRGIHLLETSFCGYPAEISFYFDHYQNEDEWGLADVTVQLRDEDAANEVYNILHGQLGDFSTQASGVAFTAWWSDAKLEELISPEAYAIYRQSHEEYPAEGGAASCVLWHGDSLPEQRNCIIFRSDLHLARQIEATITPDQTAEVAALFAQDADPWYRAALTSPYVIGYTDFDLVTFFSAGQTAVALTDAEKALVKDTYGKDALEKPIFRMTWQQMDQVLQTYIGTDTFARDMTVFLYCPETDAYLLVLEEVPELRVPEILSCQQLETDRVSMIYRFPGEEQLYCAVIYKGRDWKNARCWQVESNQLLIAMPEDSRALTEEEIARVREAFAPHTSPMSCFVLGIYGDISEMAQARFLSYYPAGEEYGEATEEEFQLLKRKYPEDFENAQTIRDMGVPITPIHADEVRALMEKYTLVRWEDLPQGGFVHYLEETDCYYTYYSDVGLFGFPCTGGWVYDGGAMLCARDHVMILTEQNGSYYIQAHLPAIVTGPPSSHTMLPAELTDEEAIAATAEAFVTAYEENINLTRDNSYDHLTVLAADPARTVGYQGKTVPLSALQKNIEYLHGKEAYWKHVCKDAGILPDTFRLTVGTENIRIDGDTATVTVYDNMTFYYEGIDGPSGMGEAYDLTLVRIDGTWLIADVTQRNDWFDADYKDDPDFDPEAMIAAHIP